jgi:hypothetical protein
MSWLGDHVGAPNPIVAEVIAQIGPVSATC